MTIGLRIRSMHRPAAPRMHNLGSAILLAAIDDYRCLDEEAHDHAQRFLYPQRPAWQNHFDWVVSLVEGLNPAWLRDALDRSRGKWDEQRLARIRRTVYGG
jgi:hypothetical protein